jgi:hypothetical protein
MGSSEKMKQSPAPIPQAIDAEAAARSIAAGAAVSTYPCVKTDSSTPP